MDIISNYYGSFTYSDKVNQNGHNKLIQDVENAQLSIIQAIDEWAESNELITEMGLSNEIIHARMLGFNEALSELHSFLKEAKTN